MIEVTFSKIVNKTDMPLVVTQVIYQKNAPAIEQDIVTIPARQTINVNKTIPFNMVDEEKNIGALPVVIKNDADHNIQFRLLLTWGENLFIDQRVQNLNTESWKDLPTIQIDKGTSDHSHVTIDLTIEGDEFELSKIIIKEKDFINIRA